MFLSTGLATTVIEEEAVLIRMVSIYKSFLSGTNTNSKFSSSSVFNVTKAFYFNGVYVNIDPFSTTNYPVVSKIFVTSFPTKFPSDDCSIRKVLKSW